ncbi:MULTISPECIES: potassium-transporting ATPase subunit KdpC [Bacillus]|uniref:potassium-transporting ATPase subunit KdpC n=1 Tax=Bacillus TaxID=1386 RepID=UPI0015818264|nr:potassium-transporting ATPase subunit KdpC [Bacillus glycinifermentans]MBU8785140.1 potassium-transporting ATPase subunit KdpC [Bacillus glycinifermentans]NUJ15309.1 potassium-transporting ATPase subunit KdpC [Bacillus glycinifermentans]
MKEIGAMIRISLLLLIVCGLMYPLAVTGISQAVMPKKANGSLIYNRKGEVIGSELIGQQFTDPRFFNSRVSSIGYDASSSGSPNEAPSNSELLKRVKTSISEWKKENPDVPVSKLPIDLITNSASGLDPDISPAAAYAQIPRISRLTGISKAELEQLVEQHVKKASLFSEARVNVLLLNIDLKEELK